MNAALSRIGRRDFLTKVALGALASPLVLTAQRTSAFRGATALAKPALTQDDFEYVGVLRVPAEVSAFSAGAMTARRVGANLQFVMSGHRYSDAVFEFVGLPPAPSVSNAPRPPILAWAEKVSGAKRTSWQDNGVVRTPSAWWTGGLCWYRGQLLWTYYDPYNVAGFDDFALGMTSVGAQGGATGLAANGPWRTQAGSHKSGGWIIEIPSAFADEFCGGARIGVGAGLTAENASSSWGPVLYAVVPPTATTPAGYGSAPLPAMPLVGHAINHRQARDTDYIIHQQTDIPPSAGVGYWTETDALTGACWIDLPDKHGLLFAGYLGSGDVWYGPSTLPDGVAEACGVQFTGRHAASRATCWWIYDPADLARVAIGTVDPWDIQPSTIFDPRAITNVALSCPPTMTGMWFDPATRNLYVACPGADPQPSLQTPLIHVWHVK